MGLGEKGQTRPRSCGSEIKPFSTCRPRATSRGVCALTSPLECTHTHVHTHTGRESVYRSYVSHCESRGTCSLERMTEGCWGEKQAARTTVLGGEPCGDSEPPERRARGAHSKRSLKRGWRQKNDKTETALIRQGSAGKTVMLGKSKAAGKEDNQTGGGLTP